MGTVKELLDLLGGGVIYAGLDAEALDASLPHVRSLPRVKAASLQDGRLKIEAHEVRTALLELIELSNAQHLPLRSLAVLEPNLESVFLHLTGKRLARLRAQ
ncbi:MAG: hypothetical protein ACK4WM_09380 [Thermoflexales bacterium]